VLGRRILLAGGRTTATTLTGRMWWFDPATSRFRRAGRLPHHLADSAVVQGHGRAWLVGGETPTYSTRVLRLALAG
jgi:N-acetylneuraminic acid mutarotase